MSRIIKTGSPGKDRYMLQKGIALAIRELSKQSGMDESTKDLLAFISLSLKAITKTVEESVMAWEKRGYWIKADHFRMEWIWTDILGEDLKRALFDEDWASVVEIMAQVTQKLSAVKLSIRNQLETPWIGSFQKLKSSY